MPIKIEINPHLHSVHNCSKVRHLHERGDVDGTGQKTESRWKTPRDNQEDNQMTPNATISAK